MDGSQRQTTKEIKTKKEPPRKGAVPLVSITHKHEILERWSSFSGLTRRQVCF